MAKLVTITLKTALQIRTFLPRNPNQMRGQAPETKRAVLEFVAAIEQAQKGNGK